MATRKILEVLLKIVICSFVSLFLIGAAMEFIHSDFGIATVGILAFYTCYRALNRQLRSGALKSGLEVAKKESGNDESQIDRPYRFTFTHEESVLDAIEDAIAKHPQVEYVFQDSGFWYSNGETGPEWFSMTIECQPQHTDEIQHFINALLLDRGKSSVRFISS